jgi:hypothetical protein
MKITVLIIFCFTLCLNGWAQDSPPADVPKDQQPVGAAARVINSDKDKKEISVFPNPSNGIIRVILSGFKGKRIDLQIMNVIGNVVHREVVSDPDDRFIKTIDLSKNTSGLYYVKLQTEEFSEIRKVIIN